MNYAFRTFILCILINLSCLAETQASFDIPEGWQVADQKSLPKSVKLMVVGKSSKEMPPSINLGYEEFQGSLKDYLKIVQDFNRSQGDTWRDLGTVQTKAGPGSLSQLDMKSQWGNLRMMHMILKKDSVVYILTASSLKEEFSKYYPVFFKALQSFQLKDISEPGKEKN